MPFFKVFRADSIWLSWTSTRMTLTLPVPFPGVNQEHGGTWLEHGRWWPSGWPAHGARSSPVTGSSRHRRGGARRHRGLRRAGGVPDPGTVKASGGLAATLSPPATAFGQRGCFIHAGGLFSVFPLAERPSRALDAGPAAGGATAAAV